MNSVLSKLQEEKEMNPLVDQDLAPEIAPAIAPEMTPRTRRKLIDDASIVRTLKHSKSFEFPKTLDLDSRNESTVLVLYTGGTIGMMRNADGALAPQPNMLEAKIRQIITMHDEEYARNRFLGSTTKEKLPLVLPTLPGKKRVVYTIDEYDPLLDSSNMTMDDWLQMANDIRSAYLQYDGFVIMHGTDTLSYTSSALSFMLENLGKTVIVTGSQIPLFETRSDGRDNLVGALILAGNYNIPEVTVYFNHKLMRGNRTIKVSAGSLDAFESPNSQPLATVGINITVDYRSIWRSGSIAAMRVQENMCRDVVLLRLFPSIRTDTVQHFLNPPIKGVVLQCYGAGNMPSNRKDIIEAIKKATDNGVIVISCTQCSHGAVTGDYETGKALIDVGVIQGSDITPEAALTKLSYILGKDEWDVEKKRNVMEMSIRGEMTLQFETVNPKTQEVQKLYEKDLNIIDEVSKAMNLSTTDEMEHINSVLFPSLICSVVHLGDVNKLKLMEARGANMNSADYDGRTALHVAASQGKQTIIKWLLERGASVHARDYNNDTPLMCAVKAGQEACVRILSLCGGNHGMNNTELGDYLVHASGLGQLTRVKCLITAGASSNIQNSVNGNTPLHAAIEANHAEMCKLLVEHGAKLDTKNKYGHTPVETAIMLNRENLLNLYLSNTTPETS